MHLLCVSSGSDYNCRFFLYTSEMKQKIIAELIGTFVLVVCGTGAIIVNDVSHGAVTHPGISLVFGLVVLALIYALGDVSGAHLNPAVSISFVLAGRFPARDAIYYCLAQVSGAILASLFLRCLFVEHEKLGATVPHGSWLQSFFLELFLTWFLVLVIFRVSTGAKEKGITAGIAVGSVIALEALFAGPISGASMNPARSLAPALVSGHLSSCWVYLTATVLGGLLAIPTHRTIT